MEIDVNTTKNEGIFLMEKHSLTLIENKCYPNKVKIAVVEIGNNISAISLVLRFITYFFSYERNYQDPDRSGLWFYHPRRGGERLVLSLLIPLWRGVQ